MVSVVAMLLVPRALSASGAASGVDCGECGGYGCCVYGCGSCCASAAALPFVGDAAAGHASAVLMRGVIRIIVRLCTWLWAAWSGQRHLAGSAR